MKRVEKFLKQETCPACHGTRLSEAARAPRLQGISLDEACTMTAGRADPVGGRRARQPCPEEMRPMAESICESFQHRGQPPDGPGAGLSDPGPRRVHPLHR